MKMIFYHSDEKKMEIVLDNAKFTENKITRAVEALIFFNALMHCIDFLMH